MLDELLRRIWCDEVLGDWQRKDRIGTEHDLQACFYFHLRNSAEIDPGWIFVESRVAGFQPDICIAARDETWLIELKVQGANKQGVVWQKDFDKFAKLGHPSSEELVIASRHRAEVSLRRPLRFLFAVAADNTCRAVQRAAIMERRSVGLPPHLWLATISWAAGSRVAPEADFEQLSPSAHEL